MAKKKSGLIATIPPTEKNVSQNYLDTNLKTYTRKSHLREGEGRPGVLTMVVEDEQFEFVELSPVRWTRNPKVWQGEYINVHLDKNGHYQVHLKNLEMGDGFNAVRIGNAITNEFKTAKKVLGL
ncbi:MAG: hypothetical protein II644_06200 [Paludibacteraceae bacterium]|nr:hypothetical protein [Paludibacteraceae bacterium]